MVFEKAADRTRVREKNFPALTPLGTLKGAWEVSFDPTWDAPQHITFAELQDWTEHTEESIRHYSGTAIYRKTFDRPAGMRSPTYLDLGVVKNLAHVRLNGHDLGVLWTAPWRVEVGDLLRARGARDRGR